MIGVDHRLERWVVHHRGEPFDTFFVALSRLGSFGIVWIVLALLAVFLWRRPFAFPLVLLADLASDAVAEALKAGIDRARPVDDPLVHVPHSGSFPSGHAATSFACAATLGRFAPRGTAVALYALAVLIAFSRVYVGVHYPLDVLAGAALGLLVATALLLLPAVLRRSPRAPRGG